MKNQIKYDNDKIQIALNYIKTTDFKTLKDGKINITEMIWANLQTYTTKEDALFEAHRKYIDIQYIISGTEKIGVAELKNCHPEISYDTQKDIEFLSTDKFTDIEMLAGDFLILYPKDAHKPSISKNSIPTQVRKLVIKIPVT